MLPKKYIIFVSLISLISISCYKSNKADFPIRELHIDNSSIEKSVDISEIIDEVKIVPLKETKGNHFGEIFKICATQNHFIVFDMIQTNTLFLFDKTGNFIKTIMKPGIGPDETLQINDFWIVNNAELEVYDHAVKKVYQFDSTFTLKNVLKSSDFYMLDNIVRIPNSNKYVGYSGFTNNPTIDNKCYHLAFFDQSLKISKTDLYYDQKYQGIEWLSLRNHFYQYKDSLRLIQAYDNYIYDISKSSVNKIYKLKYQKNSLPDNVLEKIVDKNLSIFKSRSSSAEELKQKSAFFDNYALFRGTWLENEKYIYIGSKEKNSWFFSIINKQTNRAEYNARSFCETLRFKINFPYLQFYDVSSDSFMGFVFGENLNQNLFKESKFRNEFTIDPDIYYIISVKFKL